jgi:hypothetical protein
MKNQAQISVKIGGSPGNERDVLGTWTDRPVVRRLPRRLAMGAPVVAVATGRRCD